MSDENTAGKLHKAGLCVQHGHRHLHQADPAAPPPRSSYVVLQRGPWFEEGRPSPQCSCPSQAGGRVSPAPPASCLKGCLHPDKHTLLYNPAWEWYTLCIVLRVMTEQISPLFKYLQGHKKVETPHFKLFNAAAYHFLLFDFAVLFCQAAYICIYTYILCQSEKYGA